MDNLIAKRWMKSGLACVVLTLIAMSCGAAPATPMTKEQGDAILNELREIRRLIANQAPRPAPAAANAAPQTITVRRKAQYVMGDSKAPLTMVAITDFQCSFCARFEKSTFPEIKKNYIDTGKMQFILYDLPLDFHPFAIKAAQSVRCAGEQGKYWEMKDIVFRNQEKIDVGSLMGYGKELALNEDTLKKCMSDGKYLQEIADEAKYVRSLGVSGTPTFVIGKAENDLIKGKVIVGAQPMATFDELITDMLKRD